MREQTMSMPIPVEVDRPLGATGSRLRPPQVSAQSIARARWIAESDPRVAVVVAQRDMIVSAFVSAPHSRSGNWAIGIRYMATSRSGLELVVSAVVDLFAGEILSIATFEPLLNPELW